MFSDDVCGDIEYVEEMSGILKFLDITTSAGISWSPITGVMTKRYDYSQRQMLRVLGQN